MRTVVASFPSRLLRNAGAYSGAHPTLMPSSGHSFYMKWFIFGGYGPICEKVDFVKLLAQALNQRGLQIKAVELNSLL